MIRKSGNRFSLDKREAFARRSCSNKKLERDDDSKKSHAAPGAGVAGIVSKRPNRACRTGRCPRGDCQHCGARKRLELPGITVHSIGPSRLRRTIFVKCKVMVIPPSRGFARKTQFLPPDQRDLGRPVPSGKIFWFSEPPNHFYIHSRPPHSRGVSRSSRTRGWMRWTLGGASDESALLADGEVVWS